jgi:hypothetical protein
MLPLMASVASYTLSDLIQHPTRVTAAVEACGRVVLRRRNAPDLVLSRSSELSELQSFARLLSRLVRHLGPAQLAAVSTEAMPWTRYLSDEGRVEFLADLPAVVQDCEELGTFAPLEIYLAEWRSTAAAMADPELSDRLTRPVPEPLGKSVEQP